MQNNFPQSELKANNLTVDLKVTNLTRDDFLFLTGVIKLLSDPDYVADMNGIRAGLRHVNYVLGVGCSAEHNGRQN